MEGSLHICAPPVVKHDARKMRCPDCKKESLVLTFFYEWYGPDSTCLRCGRRWSDGEWMPLDFVRGARRKSKESAKRRWRELRGKGGDRGQGT
jgi:hypothetical protein